MQKPKDPKEVKVLMAEPQVVFARFSPCGKYLVAASYDSRIRRWDASQAEWPELPAIAGHGGWITALALRSEGELLYSGDSWGQIRASTYAGEQPATRWSIAAAHDGWVRDLAVSPDGTRLASSGIDKKVRIWSTADGAKQTEFSTGTGANFVPRNGCMDGDVSCLRFTADGQSLLTADFKGVVKLWNLSNGQCVREFNAGVLAKLDRLQDVGGVHCVAFDKEQKWLAVGGTTPKNGGTVTGPPTLLVFDFATGELKHTLNYGTPNDCFVTDVAFLPDGMLLVTTCGTPGSGQLLFQRLGDPEPLLNFKKVINLQSLSVHPDAQRIAIVGTNAGSNGNGRPLDKEGKYPVNKSPIHVLQLEWAGDA